MNDEYYRTETQRLREALADAIERGDYFLEHDIKESILTLQEIYYKDEE